jgi:acyl phosphate:glycerol-3-phosphate acyltransferase
MTSTVTPLLIIGLLALSFLVGSIPFGYLIGRFVYRTDLRKHGSGNIGAMNALRTVGKGGAIAVLLLDAAKGAVIPLVLLHQHADGLASIAGACAVLGHCFSPWLGWKGGKGVATAYGVVFALAWPAGLIVVAAWIAGALLLTRYSSVGSMAGSIVSPFALYGCTHDVGATAFGVFLACFIPWTHRENIARLRSGTEGPITLFRRT